MNHVMLDLETLGVKPGCIVLSVGACLFNSMETLEAFRVHIDPLDSERHGLKVEAATAMWWLDQPKEAQEALTKYATVSLEEAIDQLAKAFDWPNVQVWCNGAAFDFPIITAIHSAVGAKTPWKYWQEMDYRTIKNLYGKEAFRACKVDPTIKHDCVADAVAQAQTLINLLANGPVRLVA